jgi:hypothetical protein
VIIDVLADEVDAARRLYHLEFCLHFCALPITIPLCAKSARN